MIGQSLDFSDPWLALLALTPILGHVFPIFAGFRGGKGVATAIGVLVVIMPWVALWAFVIMSLWGIGTDVVIYLAALQGVPVALYEAAKIDGAGAGQRFFNITLPLITPVILFTLVIGVIGSFQTFTQSYIMTGGGPANATLFFLLYLYRNAFNWFEMGYASALAWFLFIIILVCTLALWRTSGRWVFYEGGERN